MLRSDSTNSRLQLVSTSGQIDLVIMAGNRAKAAAARGRARSGMNKGAIAGSKRKAQDVLCTGHSNGSTTPRQAAAQSQSQQTMKNVRATFWQAVSSASRPSLVRAVPAFSYLDAAKHHVYCNVPCLHRRQVTLKPRFRNRVLLSWLVSKLWNMT